MAEKNSSQNLKENNWIAKSNTLNEIRNNAMTIAQQRFFCIYLSKINPNDESTRLVKFKLSEYVRIMGFKQLNVTRLEETAQGILRIIAKFKEPCGFTMCQIFKQFKLYKDTDEEWYVAIDCHDDVLPYMFGMKKYFFKYQLWNALRLSSGNQIRMYEILKQYEKAGAREISVQELREFLGIEPTEYREFANFRRRVLDGCQRALEENTDIKFTYEPIKKGKGGKITALKFNIEKNTDYIDQLTLEEFLEDYGEGEVTDPKEMNIITKDYLEFISSACDDEFDEPQLQLIWTLLIDIIPLSCSAASGSELNDFARYDFLQKKYAELNVRAARKDLPPLKSRFGYFKEMLERVLIDRENNKANR